MSEAKEERAPERAVKKGYKRHAYMAALIALYIVVSRFLFAIFWSWGFDPAGRLLDYVVLVCLIGYWFDRDSLKHHVDWAFDMGLFLYLAWFVVIPVYLYKARGLKRAALICGAYLLLALGSHYLGDWAANHLE